MSSTRIHSRDLLAAPAGRRLVFAVLYLSEGAPIGFIWWALPTLLSRSGVGLATITSLTSVATLPWVLKFLAGPLIDTSVLRGVGLRRWIIGCQLVMGLALVPLVWLDWSTASTALAVLLLVHAVAAATQDVAIDTLAIRSVPVGELGRVNGWMQSGMLLGRAGVAALALTTSVAFGQAAMIGALVMLVWLPALVLGLATREPPEPRGNRPAAGAWLQALVTPAMLGGLWIALTAGSGFEFLGVAAGPLLGSLGFGGNTPALFFGAVAPLALACGALLGGRLADRLGASQMTIVSVGAVAALAIGLAGLTRLPQANANHWLAALAVIYAGAGCLTASSYALFMDLARGRLAATRYSALMAMTNACEAWSGLGGGRIHAASGYGGALTVMALLSLLAMPALIVLRRRDQSTNASS